MLLQKYEDSLEASTNKFNFPRSDHVWCVKTNVNVIRVAKLGRYFSYPARVIQVQV